MKEQYRLIDNISSINHFFLFRNAWIEREKMKGVPPGLRAPWLFEHLYSTCFGVFKEDEWQNDMFKVYGGFPEVDQMLSKEGDI